MFTTRIDDTLKASKSVIIAGVGGGYDVLFGVPIAATLATHGCRVHFASFSSTPLRDIANVTWHTDSLAQITPSSSRPSYFPEGWLARWLQGQDRCDPEVWCFEASGVGPLYNGYKYLVDHLAVDTIIAVDGGVDSLLRGDEYALGSPLEDALTLAALSLLDTPRKMLVATAFGAERLDRICHAQVLAQIADLIASDSFYGAETVVQGTLPGDAINSAIDFVLSNQQGMHQSVVCGSILAALTGNFGDTAVSESTQSTPPWVSPLMLLYWWFDLDAVARTNLYLPRILGSRTFPEAAERLGQFMRSRPRRGWGDIPI